MEKCLLSIDWDYFIYTQHENWGSYIENTKNMVYAWYKRYFQAKRQGKDIQMAFLVSPDVETFWDNIRKHFCFGNGLKAYVSDSHSLSYDIAASRECTAVYLFDSHADLGYGGLPSLDFEVNCANWLGKLLKDKRIREANIIYSAHTTEKPEYFSAINSTYNVRYLTMNDLGNGIEVAAIHICRSGAWTPPWLDNKFIEFVESSRIPSETADCPARKWDTVNISFSDQIRCLMA